MITIRPEAERIARPRFHGVTAFAVHHCAGVVTCGRVRVRRPIDKLGVLGEPTFDEKSMWFTTNIENRFVLQGRNDMADDIAIVECARVIDDWKTLHVKPIVGRVGDGECWAMPIKGVD